MHFRHVFLYTFVGLSLSCVVELPAPAPAPEDQVEVVEEVPGVQSRMPRLSHSQYELTIRDLFSLGDDTNYAENLRLDSSSGGAIFEKYGSLRVDNNLWQGYRRVAEILALEHSARLAAEFVEGEVEQRRDRFIEEQGKRFHRRPLSAAEVEQYRELFNAADNFYNEEQNAFEKGIRVLLEMWLQSPHFLYRPELSVTESEGKIVLNDFEMASRMSYAIWGTMPDDILLAAAESGALSTREQVEAQARRLLSHEKADATVGAFHAKLFGSDAYASVQPPESFGTSADFGAALVHEQNLFVSNIFAQGEGLESLLTSTTTFVNAELAALYGVEGDFADDVFSEVTLDDDRAGILTRAGFLAKNAAGGQPDPIHRGVFISSKLACNIIPAPPDDIPSLPADEGSTNREQIEALTEVEGSNCAGCHSSTINPYGFPLEHYDAIGQYRELDRGFEIDTTSRFFLDGQPNEIDGAREFVQALVASEQVHECYAKHWLNFLYGREKSESDASIISNMANMSLLERASWTDLIVELVTSDAFRFRSLQEEE